MLLNYEMVNLFLYFILYWLINLDGAKYESPATLIFVLL